MEPDSQSSSSSGSSSSEIAQQPPMFGQQPGSSEVTASRMINLDDIFADCFFGRVGDGMPSANGAAPRLDTSSGDMGCGGGGGMGTVPSSSAASGGGCGGEYDEDDYDDEEIDEDGIKRKRARPQQMRGMSEQQKVERRCVKTPIFFC